MNKIYKIITKEFGTFLLKEFFEKDGQPWYKVYFPAYNGTCGFHFGDFQTIASIDDIEDFTDLFEDWLLEIFTKK